MDIDHLVVTAPSLARGAAYIRDQLGVEMQPGGEHRHMGTHNLLLKLGPATYLEVIAVNPAAPAPRGPRWFGLDHVTEPALSAWVVRVDDIRAAVLEAPSRFGDIMQMSRGALSWLLVFPADMNTFDPLFIQWLSGPHPASRLPDSGCAFLDMAVRPAGLVATLHTPLGLRTLRTSPGS